MEGYTQFECIGRGGSASVYRAWKNGPNQRQVALKLFRETRQAFNEANALHALAHSDHIVHLLACGTIRRSDPNLLSGHAKPASSSQTALVLEYCAGGSVASIIASTFRRQASLQLRNIPPRSTGSNTPTLLSTLDPCHAPSHLARSGTALPRTVIVAVLRGLLRALADMHASGLMHRDVKAANILLTRDGRALLADMGMAARIKPALARLPSGPSPSSLTSSSIASPACAEPRSTAQRRRTAPYTWRHTPGMPLPDIANIAGPDALSGSRLAGSTHWLAPEVIKRGLYSPAADVWAVGVTAIELVDGAPPRDEEHPFDVLLHTARRKEPPQPRYEHECLEGDDNACSAGTVGAFVAACCAIDPDMRPRPQELLERHPLFKSNARMEDQERWAIAQLVEEEVSTRARERQEIATDERMKSFVGLRAEAEGVQVEVDTSQKLDIGCVTLDEVTTGTDGLGRIGSEAVESDEEDEDSATMIVHEDIAYAPLDTNLLSLRGPFVL